MRRIIISLLLLSVALSLPAQVTGVSGTVTDADTGERIPYASLVLKASGIGTSADDLGLFTLEARIASDDTLLCTQLGYSDTMIPVKAGSDTVIAVRLRPEPRELVQARVKADNRLARRLLSGIERNRPVNSPELRPHYSCDVYSKTEIDLTNLRKEMKPGRFRDQFGFVTEYVDTTSDGRREIPAMISETVARRWHSSSPDTDCERILANRITGVPGDDNILSQFTGSLNLDTDFYDSFLNVCGVYIPSPAQKSGLMYYDYFIVDTLNVEGRKTYQVRYHPKKGIATPAFDGEMLVDAGEYAIRSIRARMVDEGSVNWIRDLELESEYGRGGDSLWFYNSDRLTATLSVEILKSDERLAVRGNRTIKYSNPDYVTEDMPELSAGRVAVAEDAGDKGEEYWQSVRPELLSSREKGIDEMVARVQEQPLYNTLRTLATAIVTGYVDIGPIGIGPVLRMVSFNNLEGFRPQIGLHTSKSLSKDFRITAYGAYGTRDKAFKGGVTYEQMFGKDPTRKLTVEASYDECQLGKGESAFTEGNIISSIWADNRKISPVSSFSARYDHEFSQYFNAAAEIRLRRHYSNSLVPMTDWSGEDLGSVAVNEAGLQLRFSRDETVSRGHFDKTYLHSYHPVWTLGLTGSVPGLRQGDTGYFKPEITFDYNFNIPPLGFSRVRFNAGTILGKVPYPCLHIHAGNVTGLLDRTAFSCMDYFEFASDSWATFLWDHDFRGFFLGRIPLIKKLELREVFILKAAWGRLSDRNNGTSLTYGALMPFPEGMKSLDTPYVEIGAGITNILRLFRVDFSWRLTHLDTARRPFAVNFGMDFRF